MKQIYDLIVNLSIRPLAVFLDPGFGNEFQLNQPSLPGQGGKAHAYILPEAAQA
jgi:hypothetical protein